MPHQQLIIGDLSGSSDQLRINVPAIAGISISQCIRAVWYVLYLPIFALGCRSLDFLHYAFSVFPVSIMEVGVLLCGVRWDSSAAGSQAVWVCCSRESVPHTSVLGLVALGRATHLLGCFWASWNAYLSPLFILESWNGLGWKGT